MKVNKTSNKLCEKLIERYGHILSKYAIYEEILRAKDAKECEIEIAKMYLDELQSSWN